MTATPPPAPDLYEAECAACHDRSMPGTHAALLLWEGEHRRLTRHGAFTASVYRPTPDTRPRCGGTPGNGGLLCFQHGIYHPQTSHVKACYCSGCADCAQPAPTPSGDAHDDSDLSPEVEALLQRAYYGHWNNEDWARALASRDTALQEARAEAAEAEVVALRERLSASDRELSALSSDKQTLMTAVTHWRERAEALRNDNERLRGEAWKEHVPCTGTQHDPANGLIHGYCVRCRTPWPCEWSPEAAAALAPAASRPVPAVKIEMTDTYGLDTTYHDGSRPVPAAIPSTDEEGRKDGGHGHVYPRPDGAKARCGGPALCSVCARDAAALARSTPAPTNEEK